MEWRLLFGGKKSKNGITGDGYGFRFPRSGMPARQRPGYGRRPHRRQMETPSGDFSSLSSPLHSPTNSCLVLGKKIKKQ